MDVVSLAARQSSATPIDVAAGTSAALTLTLHRRE
jgi:hypothetical protein